MPTKSDSSVLREVELPQEVMVRISEYKRGEINQVMEALGDIEIIEYEGNPGKNQYIISQGVHGEETYETENSLIVEAIDKELEEHLTECDGNITLIRNFNSKGTKEKRREVFPDEMFNTLHKPFNLNDVSDRYKRGDWREFFALETKTEMYSWLMMKYLVTKKEEQAGLAGKTIFLDIHRTDRSSLPLVYADWDGDERTLGELKENIAKLRLPKFVSRSSPEGYALSELLAVSATYQGLYGYTIEAGSMADPQAWIVPFVKTALIDFMEIEGTIKTSKKPGLYPSSTSLQLEHLTL